MFVCPSSRGLLCMGSPPAFHQFPKSSGAAEEHLETKPRYAWRPGGAGNALFWIPVMPSRPGDTGGRTRRRAASECSISCNVPRAKSPTVQIPQARRAHVLPRLPVNNLTFEILLDTSKLWNSNPGKSRCKTLQRQALITSRIRCASYHICTPGTSTC